jgi:tRNA1Val (adenine37-N6)-methyltransferase
MENFTLKPTHRLDDLQNKNLKIWQDTSEFCFGMDAVLLADFAAERIRNKDISADLCTGNGIVPLLVYARKEKINMTAVEINPETAALAKYNMEYNNISDRINVVNRDVKDFARENLNKFDAITVNPPYIPVGHGFTSKKESVSTARHEVALTLEELIHSCCMLLKDKGSMFMVHRAHRAAETIALMSKHRIEAKTICFIHPREGEEANLFLIEGVKNAGHWLKVLDPVFVYNDEGEYTKKVLDIYKRGEEND